MKHLLIIILLATLTLSCNKSKQAKEVVPIYNVKSQDTIVTYWQTDFDTIVKNKDVQIGNLVHQLQIKTFSLNDSSIVKINGNSKEIYHNSLTEIILKYDEQIILKSQLNKQTFKDSLSGDFLKHAVLYNVDYDFIRSNRLYFKAEVVVPDSDWAKQTDLGIFYRTHKKGKIDFWNVIDKEE